jgi:hypothetical protein
MQVRWRAPRAALASSKWPTHSLCHRPDADSAYKRLLVVRRARHQHSASNSHSSWLLPAPHRADGGEDATSETAMMSMQLNSLNGVHTNRSGSLSWSWDIESALLSRASLPTGRRCKLQNDLAQALVTEIVHDQRHVLNSACPHQQ